MQKMWTNDTYNPNFDEKISLDLNKIEPSVAGPKRPQDKILLEIFPKYLKQLIILLMINQLLIINFNLVML